MFQNKPIKISPSLTIINSCLKSQLYWSYRDTMEITETIRQTAIPLNTDQNKLFLNV
jgi:hypothetical protein